MKKTAGKLKISIALFAVSLAHSRGVSARESVGSPCDQIAKLYASCGQDFDYDGHAFYFKLKSGPRTALCDDGRRLNYYERMDDMDIASIVSIPYTPGATSRPEIRQNWDPGRLRNEDFLKSVYGSDEAAVRSHLEKVSFLNQTVMFNSQLGASLALSRAGVELANLSRTDSEVARFLHPFETGKINLKGSTFFWRLVRGTPRLSAHAFGAAIDLLTNVGPMYWLWDEMKNHPAQAAKGEQAYRDTHFIPPGAPIFNQKVVDVMEQNGFIWGGKWNHYDTMHFEYRPELLPASKIVCRSLMTRQVGHRLSKAVESVDAVDFAEVASLPIRDHD